MPPFRTGQKPPGAWNWKYATANSPDSRNATGRVKRPKRSRAPPNTSRAPPTQICEGNGAVPPAGGMPAGKAKSFIVPGRMNRRAAATFPEAGLQLLTFHYGRGNNWAFWDGEEA